MVGVWCRRESCLYVVETVMKMKRIKVKSGTAKDICKALGITDWHIKRAEKYVKRVQQR